MTFNKILPCNRLRPYVHYFVVSESGQEATYTVFPSTALVAGFQYRGQLSVINKNDIAALSSAGISGLTNSYRTFQNSANIGTILVYFTETGLSAFTTLPAHELFNESIALDNLFDKHQVSAIEEKLSLAQTANQRIRIVEAFLLSQLKATTTDQLVQEAIRLIYQSKGMVKIAELNKKLHISQSPLEKRFRKLAGATPKKFASIVRFNAILNDISKVASLTDITYDYNFFDQAHFIKEFRQYTGCTPEEFRKKNKS